VESGASGGLDSASGGATGGNGSATASAGQVSDPKAGGAGATAKGGSSSNGAKGGSAGSTESNGGAAASKAGAGTTASAGSAGAQAGASGVLACNDDVGATAGAHDFSMNTDTGQMDAHVLVMSKGDIIRRVTGYKTSGSADHEHSFEFSDEQLVKLLAGETVVVTTFGPPSTAASGHSHTVTVHPCK
jgi:hypothetical protein